jgi:hypothetical protein
MRDKKKTINIKVRDLKPKKDAKGGVVANVNTSNSSKFSVSQVNRNQSVNQSHSQG